MSTHHIEKLWREHGLPEWFLGNGGSNMKLYALYDSICAQERERCALLAISFGDFPGDGLVKELRIMCGSAIADKIRETAATAYPSSIGTEK